MSATSPSSGSSNAAARVRAIVESKENFAWPTTMEALCDLFDIPNLGPQIAKNLAETLASQNLTFFPAPLPLAQTKSVLVMLKGTRFINGFPSTAQA